MVLPPAMTDPTSYRIKARLRQAGYNEEDIDMCNLLLEWSPTFADAGTSITYT